MPRGRFYPALRLWHRYRNRNRDRNRYQAASR